MSSTLIYVCLFLVGLACLYIVLWRKKGEPYASTVTAKVFLLTIMVLVMTSLFTK